MKSEEIQDFTMRITQSNRTQLVVVIFDIFQKFADDARNAYQDGDIELFRESVSKAQPVVSELISALDFKYEISSELYRTYKYVVKSLGKALTKNSYDDMGDAVKVMTTIRNEFFEISKTDNSEPLMQNSQKVYAGLTYSREKLNETFNEEGHRGFLV